MNPTQPASSAAPTRRHFLRLAAASPLLAKLPATPAYAHNSPGVVDPPLPAPPMALTRHDGRPSTLAALLQGQVTALQLMFTGCTATCPIQGAMFAAVQAGLVRQKQGGVQLLSLSIDPLGDSPPALAAWLKKQGAGPHWRAAVPGVAGVDTLFDFLRGRSVEPDRHTAQVYLFSPRGQLLLRSTDFPAPEQVLGWLASAPRRS